MNMYMFLFFLQYPYTMNKARQFLPLRKIEGPVWITISIHAPVACSIKVTSLPSGKHTKTMENHHF